MGIDRSRLHRPLKSATAKALPVEAAPECLATGILFTIPIELAPKKNSMEIRRGGRPCPTCGQRTGRASIGHSKRRKGQWKDASWVVSLLWRGRPPISRPVILRVRWYRVRLDADPTNLDSALADVLQSAGVVTNDRMITIWSDHPVHDKKNPRVEFWFLAPGADPWTAPGAN